MQESLASLGWALLPAPESTKISPSLDPADWTDVRALGHRMLDDMFDYIEHIRTRPAWQPIPADVRARFREPLPLQTR